MLKRGLFNHLFAQHSLKILFVLNDRDSELLCLGQLAAGALAGDDEIGLLRHAAGYFGAQRLQLLAPLRRASLETTSPSARRFCR